MGEGADADVLSCGETLLGTESDRWAELLM